MDNGVGGIPNEKGGQTPLHPRQAKRGSMTDMPRRPRLHLPDVPQHVIQRGVDRQPVFFSDDDCRFYLDWLGEYASKRDVALHAYCLITL